MLVLRPLPKLYFVIITVVTMAYYGLLWPGLLWPGLTWPTSELATCTPYSMHPLSQFWGGQRENTFPPVLVVVLQIALHEYSKTLLRAIRLLLAAYAVSLVHCIFSLFLFYHLCFAFFLSRLFFLLVHFLFYLTTSSPQLYSKLPQELCVIPSSASASSPSRSPFALLAPVLRFCSDTYPLNILFLSCNLRRYDPPSTATMADNNQNNGGNGFDNGQNGQVMQPPPLHIPQNNNPIPTAITSPIGGDKSGLMSPTSAAAFARRSAPEPNKRALYVGGLDQRVTEDVLRQIFETTGHVQNVKIIPDKNVSSDGGAVMEILVIISAYTLYRYI